MELIITLVLITLLVIAVCNLIGLKARTIAVATILLDIAYIAVVLFTVDLSGVWLSFSTWLTDMGNEFMEGFK